MVNDDPPRSIAELLDDPVFVEHPALRSAVARLAEQSSAAEGRALAALALLDQQDREARSLRSALESLQSERRTQLASARRLLSSMDPGELRSPIEACAVLEISGAGFDHCVDLRSFGESRALVALAHSSSGAAAPLQFAEWRSHFYDLPLHDRDPLMTLGGVWARIAAEFDSRGWLFVAVVDTKALELVAQSFGPSEGAIVVGRTVLPLASCTIGLEARVPVLFFEQHTAEHLAVLGPNRSRAAIDALVAAPIAQWPELVRAKTAAHTLAAAALLIPQSTPVAASAPVGHPFDFNDDQEEQAWVEHLGRSGSASPETVRALASRYTRLARRLVKIERISDSYQRELRTSSLELEELNADLAEFSGRVAHDLKTPLTAIIGFASMLGEPPFCSDPALVRASVKDILWSSEKMVDIIDALLLLAKARRGAVAMEPVVVSGVFEQVRKRVEALSTERKATLRLESNDCVVAGHGPWVEAALVNLVTNAIRYGGTPPVVTIAAQIEENQVVLSVADNGRGLTEAERGRLFQPFVRLSKDAGGHGLGLTIVRRVVERMNGSIRVNSVVGQGSVFAVNLPRATPGSEAAP